MSRDGEEDAIEDSTGWQSGRSGRCLCSEYWMESGQWLKASFEFDGFDFSFFVSARFEDLFQSGEPVLVVVVVLGGVGGREGGGDKRAVRGSAAVSEHEHTHS